MPATPTLDPTVLRRRLRNELRKAREANQMTQREVAEAMDWSLSKLIRIESGQVSVATNDLKALLAHYRVTDDAKVTELINSARASRERSWWRTYRDVASAEYLELVGYESSASHIRGFEPIVVPGLLQTEEYARRVIGTSPRISPKDVPRLLKLRLERQDRVLSGEHRRMYFILDEAVIWRIVGNLEVMQEQYDRLVLLDKQPNVEILVMPFKAGFHPLSETPMVHFQFSGPDDEDVLCIEDAFGAQIVVRESATDEATDVSPSRYLDLFWRIENIARKYNALALLEAAKEHLIDMESEQLGEQADVNEEI